MTSEEPPNIIWRADYHCKLISQYVANFVIIDDISCRYGTRLELERSLQDTKYMTITNLRFTKYQRVND